MTDKENKKMGDEYQFPHDEYVAAEDDSSQANYGDAFHTEEQMGGTEESARAEPSESKPSILERFPILQNKRLLMVVGVVVLAIIAFKVMSPSHSVKVVKQAQVQARPPSAQQEQQSAMLSKLNNLSQDASSSKNVVNQLQGEVNELKMTLNKADSSNEAMKQAMIALAQQVENLSAQVKKATTTPNHIKKLPPSPVLTFNLRAIIPGRAWVMGSNGEQDSVAVGSKLKNYGTVKAIDVDAGKVLTSSGKVITYNADGN